MPEEAIETKFAQWARVEVFGHQFYEGFVTETTIGGCPFVQIDVPEQTYDIAEWDSAAEKYVNVTKTKPAFRKLLGQAAIFSITPIPLEESRKLDAKYGTQSLADENPLLELPAAKAAQESK